MPGRRSVDRRRQLAGIAAELFHRHGYAGVGVGDIAAVAGITGPALYRHFAGKQAVLAFVLLDEGIDCMIRVVEHARTAFADQPAKAQRYILETMAELSVSHREVSALWRWQGHHLHKEDYVELLRRAARMQRQWQRLLCERRPDLAEDDAALLCWAAMSVFGSVADHHVSLPKRRFEAWLVDLAATVLDLTPATTVPTAAPADDAWRQEDTAAASRREQVLAVATRLFGERGYDSVSMEDIGAAAGIAGPSVYRHFAGKQEIMLAAAYRMAERLTDGARQAVAGASDPTDALQRLVQSYVDILLRPDGVPMRSAGALDTVPDRDRRELRLVQRNYVAQWVRLLRAVRPELADGPARIAVHAALTIINDLPRTRQVVAARPDLGVDLVAIGVEVLRRAVEAGPDAGLAESVEHA